MVLPHCGVSSVQAEALTQVFCFWTQEGGLPSLEANSQFSHTWLVFLFETVQ